MIGNGKIVAKDGSLESRVQVFHWWPGREWAGSSPIPPSAIGEAQRRGSRYVTFAVADLPQGPVGAWAFCCPRDCPSRTRGRTIALGRLGAALQGLGWRLEDAPESNASRFDRAFEK